MIEVIQENWLSIDQNRNLGRWRRGSGVAVGGKGVGVFSPVATVTGGVFSGEMGTAAGFSLHAIKANKMKAKKINVK